MVILVSTATVAVESAVASIFVMMVFKSAAAAVAPLSVTVIVVSSPKPEICVEPYTAAMSAAVPEIVVTLAAFTVPSVFVSAVFNTEAATLVVSSRVRASLPRPDIFPAVFCV